MRILKRWIKKAKIKVIRFNRIEIGVWVDYVIGSLVLLYAIVFFMELYRQVSTPKIDNFYGFLEFSFLLSESFY